MGNEAQQNTIKPARNSRTRIMLALDCHAANTAPVRLTQLSATVPGRSTCELNGTVLHID
jgi:hypothetical protein